MAAFFVSIVHVSPRPSSTIKGRGKTHEGGKISKSGCTVWMCLCIQRETSARWGRNIVQVDACQDTFIKGKRCPISSRIMYFFFFWHFCNEKLLTHTKQSHTKSVVFSFFFFSFSFLLFQSDGDINGHTTRLQHLTFMYQFTRN